MTGKTFEIQVQDDHLQRISQVRKPILAVAELIWNAVDADADCIDVVLHDDNLGGFKTIEVADNGHGIPYPDAEDLFSRLGGSWKQGGHRSHEKRRILHGKEGRGRFRAFALGRVVDWHVCYVASEGLRAYRIAMVKDHLKRVQVDDEAPAGAGHHRGVTVMVSELDREFRSLSNPGVTNELAQIFALYLRQYPTVRIYYAGTLIDPHSVEDHTQQYPAERDRTISLQRRLWISMTVEGQTPVWWKSFHKFLIYGTSCPAAERSRQGNRAVWSSSH
jgi:hypothetical protein